MRTRPGVAQLRPFVLVGAVAAAAGAPLVVRASARLSPEISRLDPDAVEMIESLEEDTASSPEDGAAWGRLGLAYDAYAMTDAAADAFEKAARFQPREAKWPYHLARMRANLGDTERALPLADEALRLDPSYAPGHRQRGDWLMDLGRFDEAEASYREVMRLEPKSAAGRVGLARADLARGRNEAAIETLEQLLAEGGGDAYVFLLLGNALRRTGNVPLAKEAFARAANPRPPKWPDPWRDEREQFEVGFAADLERALESAASPQSQDAILALEALRAKHPTNVALLSNLGAAYCKAGRVEEGVATLNAALANLSLAYEATGRLPEALEAAQRAVRAHPELVQAHMREGFVLSKLGRKPEALRSFEKAWNLDHRSVASLFWCGATRCDLGDWRTAVGDFERVLAAEPRMVGTNVYLARARAESGDLAGAREALAAAEQTPSVKPTEIAPVRARIEALEREAAR